MKVALVHCYYQLRGGEDAVFEQEKQLLAQSGEVCSFVRTNRSGWRGLLDFLFSVYNLLIKRQFNAFLQHEQPDVVHIHNWHYAMGPVVIRAAKSAGIPVVVTLHNYRLLCPSATLLHHGQLFTSSLRTSFPWKAVIQGVYRNSILQTFWMAFVVWANKIMSTWQMVDKYIVLTAAAEEIFLKSKLGIPKNKFVVKPNFTVPFAGNTDSDVQRTGFLFVGRLSEEKGVFLLLDAFGKTDYPLVIAGEGPLKQEVEEACQHHPNISYLGSVSKERVQYLMETSTALVFPSIWYEPFGLVLVEALSLGCPIIASKIGSSSEIIQHGINGLHFESGNRNDFIEQLSHWQSLPEKSKEEFRQHAKASYSTQYTSAKNKEGLIDLYTSLVSMNKTI